MNFNRLNLTADNCNSIWWNVCIWKCVKTLRLNGNWKLWLSLYWCIELMVVRGVNWHLIQVILFVGRWCAWCIHLKQRQKFHQYWTKLDAIIITPPLIKVVLHVSVLLITFSIQNTMNVCVCVFAFFFFSADWNSSP